MRQKHIKVGAMKVRTEKASSLLQGLKVRVIFGPPQRNIILLKLVEVDTPKTSSTASSVCYSIMGVCPNSRKQAIFKNLQRSSNRNAFLFDT